MLYCNCVVSFGLSTDPKIAYVRAYISSLFHQRQTHSDIHLLGLNALVFWSAVTLSPKFTNYYRCLFICIASI